MKYLLQIILLAGMLNQAYSQAQAFYDVDDGHGNGIRFWENNNYKIHMGNVAENHYGPVTSYSIKMNMNDTPGRGWTWGIVGQTPIAALTNTGIFQLSNSMYVLGSVGVGTVDPVESLHVKGGNIRIDNGKKFQWASGDNFIKVGANSDFLRLQAASGASIQLRTGGSIDRMRITSGGKVGIGITSPTVKFHVVDNTGYAFGSALINTHAAGHGLLVQGGGTTGNRYIMQLKDAGGNNRMTIHDTGEVGIGTTVPDEMLTVNGHIHAKEVRVDLSVLGPDYVFSDNYPLTTLKEVEDFIQKEKHLPEIPSAKEMEANGVQLGEMNMLLLKKIEELTLYTLEQQKEIEQHQSYNKLLMQRLEANDLKLETFANQLKKIENKLK